VNRRNQTLVAALRSPAQGARASLLLQRPGKGLVNKCSDGVKGVPWVKYQVAVCIGAPGVLEHV
jgi:hypothetical protein